MRAAMTQRHCFLGFKKYVQLNFVVFDYLILFIVVPVAIVFILVASDLVENLRVNLVNLLLFKILSDRLHLLLSTKIEPFHRNALQQVVFILAQIRVALNVSVGNLHLAFVHDLLSLGLLFSPHGIA